MTGGSGARAAKTFVVLAVVFVVVPVPVAPTAVVGTEHADRTHTQFGREYNVTIENASIDKMHLRNVTMENVSIERVFVKKLTTDEGTERNVVLTNVTASEIHVEYATIEMLDASVLMIRSRSILNVPGADLVKTKLKNKRMGYHKITNQTIDGVRISRITIDRMRVVNGSLEAEREGVSPYDGGFSTFEERYDDARADLVVKRGSVAFVRTTNVRTWNWSVGERASGSDDREPVDVRPDSTGQREESRTSERPERIEERIAGDSRPVAAPADHGTTSDGTGSTATNSSPSAAR